MSLVLRALGRHLSTTSQRLELDVEQWKAHSAQLSLEVEENGRQWNLKQQEVDKQLQQINQLLEQQVRNMEA